MNSSETIYADQIGAGRNMTQEDVEPFLQKPPLRIVPRSKMVLKAKIVPKGHEAYLKALESSGASVTFEKVSSGAIFTGVIKTSDKYTISIQTVEGTRVLFKHDISEFFVNAPVAQRKDH